MQEEGKQNSDFRGFIKDIQLVNSSVGKDCIYVIRGIEEFPTWQYIEVQCSFFAYPTWHPSKIKLKRKLNTNQNWVFHDFCLWNFTEKQYESVLGLYSSLLLDPIKEKILTHITTNEGESATWGEIIRGEISLIEKISPKIG